MKTHHRSDRRRLLSVAGFLLAFSLLPQVLLAKDCREFPQASKEPIYQILKNILDDKECDKLVKVKLESGQDLEGKIKGLNDSAVVLERLSGMDFYDAVIVLDHISALIYRARSR
jgi:hypothetical protein